MNFVKNFKNLILIIFLIILNNIECNSYLTTESPCTPEDSIVLEPKHKLLNGSYLYDGILIPHNLTHIHNSKIHGCICLIKNCAPWCCSHKHQSLKNDICQDEILDVDIVDDIILRKSDFENETKNFFQHFHPQYDKKLNCKHTYALNHLDNDYDEWHMFDNATLYQPFYADNEEFAYVKTHDYCFALERDKNNSNIMVSPYFCQLILDEVRHLGYGIKILPCNLNESIELNVNQKQIDGSYIVDDILIKKKLIFNYKDDKTQKISVRGCICLIKTCVPWCCSYLNETMQNLHCREINEDEIFSELNVTLINENDDLIDVDFLENFYLQKNEMIHCETKLSYSLNAIESEEDNWMIHKNGSLTLYIDDNTKAFVPKDKYCFALHSFDLSDTEKLHTFGPHICITKSSDSVRHYVYGIALLLSQPFMIITIIVYLVIPKLRNLHGKALVCYLSSLSISYFGLAYILLRDNNNTETFSFCTFVGYLSYISIMSAYFWLSAISFDLWFNFNNYDKTRLSKRIRFYIYCGICYGTAAIYTIAMYIVQNSEYVSKSVKPGIGTHYCYINVSQGYSAVIWLYSPLICVITFNITMFLLTWRKIRTVADELSRVMDKDNGKRNLKNERNKAIFFRFHIFLRLFIIMGISWIAEIVSYFVGNEYEAYFYFTDFLNVMQGLLIFLLFVFRKDTFNLILQRFHPKYKSSSRSQFSRQYSRTTSSNMISMNQMNQYNSVNDSIENEPNQKNEDEDKKNLTGDISKS